MFGGCFCWNVWARWAQRYSLQARGDKHYLFTAGSAYRMWARSCNSVPSAALGQSKLTSAGEDAVSPSSWLNPSPLPRRSCPLCRSSASRRPPRPLLWRSLCWNSWGRSSCSSRTPPNSTSGSRASSGLLWWGQFCVGKHSKGGRARSWTLFTCAFPGFYEMRDCLHHLFHRVHHGRVQIRGRLLQGRWGKFRDSHLDRFVSVPPWRQPSFFSQIFGFIATIAFALDFYLIFNELAAFLKEGGQPEAEVSRQRGNATNQGGRGQPQHWKPLYSSVDATLTCPTGARFLSWLVRADWSHDISI